MFLIDKMLVGGIRFVLDKLVAAADQELNDDSRLRDELLAAQMRLELGEITDDQFASIEAAVLQRIREIRERRGEPAEMGGGDMKVTGIEASFGGDEEP